MDILERSPRRLILRSRPWEGWLAGMLLLIGGSVPVWLTATYELLCRHDHIPIAAIQNIDIAQEWRSSRGRRNRVFQVQLQTTDGTVRLGEFEGGEAQHQKSHSSGYSSLPG
ncbi:hypothetical protein [Parathermosynechococcus lividus]